MVKFGARVVIYLVAAVAAAALAYWSVFASRIPVEVAPVAKGEPTSYLVAYDGAGLARALVLAAVAGVLLVLAISRGVRDRRHTACVDTPQGYHGEHGDD